MCGAKSSDLLNKPLNVIWTCLCLLAQTRYTGYIRVGKKNCITLCGPVGYAVRSPTGYWNFGPYGARKLPGSAMWPKHNIGIIMAPDWLILFQVMCGSRVTPLWPYTCAHEKKSPMFVSSGHFKFVYIFDKIFDVLSCWYQGFLFLVMYFVLCLVHPGQSLSAVVISILLEPIRQY